MKALKIGLAVLGGLVALVVVGMIILLAVFDPNDYKDLAAEKVEQATGRTLTFGGDLELSVFPWIAVKTGALTFGNAPGFGEQPMVEVASASVGLKLLPLISGSVEIGDVEVDGLSLLLMRNAEGVTNWDDLAGGTEEAAGEPAPAESGSGEAGQPLDLSVGGVRVTDATVVWDDRMAGKRYTVSGAEITLGAVKPSKPFDFSIAFNVASSDPQADAAIKASGRLGYDGETRKVNLAGLKVTVDATGKAVPGGEAEVTLAASAVNADLDQQVLSVSELLLSAYGVEMSGTLTGKSFMDNPTLAGDMSVKPFNLKDTLAMLGTPPLETADPAALTKVSATMKFSYLPDAFDAPEVSITLDDTSLDASAKVTGFSAPAYYLRAKVDAIDADRYLPPEKEGQGSAPAAESESGQPAPAAGEPTQAEKDLLALLKTLNVDAALVVDKLKISGMNMTEVKVRVLAKDGVLEVTPASLKMYRGAISTATRLDGTGSRLKGGVDVDVDGVEAGDALRDHLGDKGFEGTVYFRTTETVRFTGMDEPTAAPSLSGAFAFRVLDGVFPGVDLKGLLGNAEKLKEKRAEKLVGRPEDRTEFGEMAGTGLIRQGVITNEDLCLKAPHLRAGGEGIVSLPSREVDYLVTAMLITDAQGQGGVSCKEAYGVGMPVRVSGSLTDPSFGVDAGEFLAMVARGPLRLAEAGFDTLGSALGGAVDAPALLLDSVFGGQSSTQEGSSSTGQGGGESESPGKAVEDAIKGIGNMFN